MNHKRLYIGDLGPDVNDSDLRELLTQVGSVEEVDLRKGSVNVHGYALVEMVSPDAAREAVTRFNGYQWGGYRLIVYTVPPKSRPRSSFKP